MSSFASEKIVYKVLEDLHLLRSDAHVFFIAKEENYVHMLFTNDFVDYEVYVESETQEIVGIDTVPVCAERLAVSACGEVA